jgi:hypothetical protein
LSSQVVDVDEEACDSAELAAAFSDFCRRIDLPPPRLNSESYRKGKEGDGATIGVSEKNVRRCDGVLCTGTKQLCTKSVKYAHAGYMCLNV